MKLANGSGSIVCIDKTGKKRRKPWAVRITAGWKDGKQVRKYLGYYATQREAIMALAEYHNGGINLDLNNLTVDELFDLWIDRVGKKNLSDSVIRSHRMAKQRFGALGRKLVKDVKAAHWQLWLDNIELKPATKGKVRGTIYQMLEYAVKNDIVQKNYAQGLEINEKIEQTGSIFTPEELKVLWDNVDNNEVKQLLVMCYTGMRIGELLSVHRDNIHFDEGYIIGGSKTEAGKDRVIPLHDKIKPLVKQLLGDNVWLVQSIRGTASGYTTVKTKYNELFKKFNMSHKPHDCRKTAVSIMHSAGIPMEVIRVIVGHSGEGVTERVYLRKRPDELVEYINKIEIS